MNSELTADPDLARTSWRKPRRSQANGNCIEIADGFPDTVPVRDSKNPGPMLLLPTGVWTAFVNHLKG